MVVVVGWGVQSHFIVKPNLVLRLGWGFDNYLEILLKRAHWIQGGSYWRHVYSNHSAGADDCRFKIIDFHIE